MSTILDSRQTKYVPALNTISNAAPDTLNNIIPAVDALVTTPYSLKKTTTRTIALGSVSVTNPTTGRAHSVVPQNTAMAYGFTGGNITTPAASGGNIAFATYNLTIILSASNYVRVGVFVDYTGVVTFVAGTQNATRSYCSAPAGVGGSYAVGEIYLHNTAGVIDDPLDSDIVQYATGISQPASLTGTETLTNKTLGASFAFLSQAVTLGANTLTPGTDNPILVIAGTGPVNMIANPIAGEYKILLNETGANLTINHATGGTAANQIYTPNGTPIILPNNSSIPVVYDSTLSKWIVAGGSGGGLAIMAVTAAAINGTTLSPGIHYIVDMSAASGNIAVTAPALAAGLSFRVFAVGNLNNGYNLTINAAGSDKFWYNGVATNTSYTLYNLESYVEVVADNATLGTWVVEAPGTGSGGGSSPLDANFDETFIYYTRSDFSVDKKTFFGSVASGAVDSVLGLGKVVFSAANQIFTSSDISGATFKVDNPIINTAQVRLLYNTSHIDNTFTFTVTAANATTGAVYTNGAQNYTVLSTITGGTTLSCSAANGIPTASGTLTKVSGTGDSTITFSTVSYAKVEVSLDNGGTWTTGFRTEYASNFVVVDFVFAAGSTYTTGIKVRVTSGGAGELAGFGVDMVQDSTGAYAGDATKEIRVITSGEASSGLITLVSARFTPGAGQLHCNYKGHDFIEPDFVCLGGGVVQFPANFFTTGDTAKFYVGYGLVNLSNAPVTINNILSSNDTMGSVVVPTGFTLDKPNMNIPAGAVVSGAGAVSTDGAITGTGILATTGTILSRGKAPTQPKFDVIQEATSSKGVAVQGRTDGNSQPSGYIGEEISGIGSGTANTGYTSVASMTLPIGVWDISLNTIFTSSGSSISVQAGVSTVINSSTGFIAGKSYANALSSASAPTSVVVPPYRVIINSPTTYYLSTSTSALTATVIGQIRAVRMS